MRSLGRSAMVGAALALVSTVGLVGPASAVQPQITFLSPTSGQQLTDQGSTVSAKVEMSNGTLIDQISLSVQQLDTTRAPIAASTGASASPQNVSFPITLPYNGRYRASVTAKGRDQPLDLNGPESVTESVDFVVAAPPARPTDVKTVVDASARTVAVTWKANTEPDLLFYLVQRAKGTSNDFTVLGKATEAKFADATTTDAGGDYRYQVVAVRNGVRDGEGISSDPSALSADATAKVPDPPPPPTAPPGSTVAGAPGSTVAGATGGGATGTASSVPANSPGALTSSGTVDLSGFNTVRSQTRSTPRTLPLPDPGFQSTLPFATPDPTAVEDETLTEEGGDLAELAADSPQFRELGDEVASDDRARTMTFFAAGLLATVLLMHVLWVKSEVKRVPLEAVDPEGPFPVVGRAAARPAQGMRSKRRRSGPGPTLEDIGATDFAPVVVATAGKGKGKGKVDRSRAGGNRRQKVSTGV